MPDENRTSRKVYCGYNQKELDQEYDQSALVPNIPDYQARAERESRRVRNALPCRCDVAYGESEAERLDLFPSARPGAPVLIYIHGGAWTRGDKTQSSAPAEVVVLAGAAYVAINFGLAPAVTLEELVAHAMRAVRWVYNRASSFSADPGRLFLAGHSSGAHVVGMLVTADWSALGLPPDIVRGAVATSGIYDLEPVRLSARNRYLHLDEEGAARNSPIRRIGDRGCPLIIGYGEREHREFRRQSMAFAEVWRNKGHPCREFDLVGMNHFDVAEAFSAPESRIACEMLALLGLARPVASTGAES